MQISIKNLTWSYGSSQVLECINLDVSTGDTLEVIGANGSGKTTLLNLIATIYLPEKGSFFINSKCYESQIKQYRTEVSISQATDNSFLPYLSGLENLIYFNSIRKNPLDVEREVTQILKDFNISNILTTKYENMSTGMKQTLSLLRTGLSDAAVCIYDEPTRSLSRENINLFSQLLTQQQRINIISGHQTLAATNHKVLELNKERI